MFMITGIVSLKLSLQGMKTSFGHFLLKMTTPDNKTILRSAWCPPIRELSTGVKVPLDIKGLIPIPTDNGHNKENVFLNGQELGGHGCNSQWCWCYTWMSLEPGDLTFQELCQSEHSLKTVDSGGMGVDTNLAKINGNAWK